MGDISFSFSENADPNTANGWFSVESDGFELYLEANLFHSDDQRVTPVEAAEILWRTLLDRAEISYD
jgi:hypothetical protein